MRPCIGREIVSYIIVMNRFHFWIVMLKRKSSGDILHED